MQDSSKLLELAEQTLGLCGSLLTQHEPQCRAELLHLQVATLGAAIGLLGCSEAQIAGPSAASLARQGLL